MRPRRPPGRFPRGGPGKGCGPAPAGPLWWRWPPVRPPVGGWPQWGPLRNGPGKPWQLSWLVALLALLALNEIPLAAVCAWPVGGTRGCCCGLSPVGAEDDRTHPALSLSPRPKGTTEGTTTPPQQCVGERCEMLRRYAAARGAAQQRGVCGNAAGKNEACPWPVDRAWKKQRGTIPPGARSPPRAPPRRGGVCGGGGAERCGGRSGGPPPRGPAVVDVLAHAVRKDGAASDTVW